MPNDINIHDLVQQIWSPNISQIITSNVDSHTNGRYEYMIAMLAYHSRRCIEKQLYHPYIQIQDNKGKFIFNDRLYIKNETHIDASIPNNMDIYLDFIDDGKRKNTIYCWVRYGHNPCMDASMFSIEFNKSTSGITKTEYFQAIHKLIKKSNLPEEKKRTLNADMMIHQYNAKKNTWQMRELLV